ncbi:hypothetical protein [uncultured Sphingomonas sp.]|uniref:hypothetical protein n=1 Tax=uncultured Sphingomonas sp. TaxID=158754 RepID=UPI0025F676CB|nr:hypothetical protein [uncultured Sphingomonas sp.]
MASATDFQLHCAAKLVQFDGDFLKARDPGIVASQRQNADPLSNPTGRIRTMQPLDGERLSMAFLIGVHSVIHSRVAATSWQRRRCASCRCMAEDVQWSVNVDKVTDALVHSHLKGFRPEMTLDTFLEGAIRRELDRLALDERGRAERQPPAADGMWEIVIPRPRT